MDLINSIFSSVLFLSFFGIICLLFVSLCTWSSRRFKLSLKLFGIWIVSFFAYVLILGHVPTSEYSETQRGEKTTNNEKAPSKPSQSRRLSPPTKFKDLSYSEKSEVVKLEVAKKRAGLTDEQMLAELDQAEAELDQLLALSKAQTKKTGDSSTLEHASLRFHWLNNEFYKLTQWKQKYYMNDWGDPSPDFYLSNKNKIKGYFKNFLGEPAACDLVFMIDGQNHLSISFILYEYSNNKVTSSNSFPTSYIIQIKGVADTIKLSGSNYSDRITFTPKESKSIIKILENNPNVKILVKEKYDGNVTRAYNFNNISTIGFKRSYRYYLEDLEKL
jgi:hypothetical protein